MTKHEWMVMQDFLAAVKEELDFDAVGHRLGEAANAAEGLLTECEAEGFQRTSMEQFALTVWNFLPPTPTANDVYSAVLKAVEEFRGARVLE